MGLFLRFINKQYALEFVLSVMQIIGNGYRLDIKNFLDNILFSPWCICEQP